MARTFNAIEKMRIENWNNAADNTLREWNDFAAGRRESPTDRMAHRAMLCTCYLWLKSVGIVKSGDPRISAMETRLADRIAAVTDLPPLAAGIHAGSMLLRMTFTRAMRDGIDLGESIRRIQRKTDDSRKASMKWSGFDKPLW